MHPVVQAEVQIDSNGPRSFQMPKSNAPVQHGYEVSSRRASANDSRPKRHTQPATLAADTWRPAQYRRRLQIRSLCAIDRDRELRQLRGSSRRRAWTTLLDPRDWPSYVYVLAALVLFVYSWQVYKLYKKSEMQATVINAIASGDPIFVRILDLLDKDPPPTGRPSRSAKPDPTELDYRGWKYSRIAGCSTSQ